MFKSVKTRLIVLFLLLAFIPLIFLRVVAYPRAIKAFKVETEKHLRNAGIKQVFLNLILNARDVMPGGGTLEIATKVNPDGTVNLQVSDSGVGIPKKELERIFCRFIPRRRPEAAPDLAFIRSIQPLSVPRAL